MEICGRSYSPKGVRLWAIAEVPQNDFSEWGTFWSHHIVPLTNQIVDDFQGDAQAKLHIRSDPHIHKAVEELVMGNYSVFYYLARSCALVTYEPHLFLENAFIFLRAAAENAGLFFGCFKSQVAPAFGIDRNQVPEWKSIKAGQTHKEIVDYRDALVHRGRLGRNPKLPWEFIPKHSHLEKAQFSWRYVQDLPEDQFVDGRKHLRILQRNLMKELNPVWKKITHLTDQRTTTDKYLRFYRLEKGAPPENCSQSSGLRLVNWWTMPSEGMPAAAFAGVEFDSDAGPATREPCGVYLFHRNIQRKVRHSGGRVWDMRCNEEITAPRVHGCRS